jgi:hypothetical protein
MLSVKAGSAPRAVTVVDVLTVPVPDAASDDQPDPERREKLEDWL